MTNTRSIVCAVDFSAPSLAALRAAAEVARKTRGRVTALCVEDPLLAHGAAAYGYDTALLRKSTLMQLRKVVDRVVPPTGLSSDAVSVEMVLGHPGRAIVSFAKKIGADLIAMGTSGRTGAGRLFLGFVASEVLRRAPIPVLVVPGPKMPEGWLKRPVVGAIDSGPADKADARRIAGATRGLGPVTLVHVMTETPAPWQTTELAEHDQTRLAGARSRVAKLARAISARSRVVAGFAWEEIPAAAIELKAGLIVLVLRKGRGLLGPRQGAMTYRVLCVSKCPVLAVP